MAMVKNWFKAVALLTCLITPALSATSALKEYSYPSDGFAIKFPYEPQAHPDAADPERKVWTVHLTQHGALSIRVIVDSQSCDVALNKLKAMAASKNVPIREFSVSGRPAWEEKDWRRGPDTMISERYVCGMGRFYVLTLAWLAAEHKPELGMEIMDSFRLLK